MFISPDSIQRVNDVPVEDIIGQYVSLKKAGAQYRSCCPFHDEKTPSFTVTPSKGIFKCFGCGEGGNGINFVMKYERLEWKDAIKKVAEISGVKLEYIQGDDPEYKERKEKEDNLHSVLEWANGKFVGQFKGSPAEAAMKDRGFEEADFKFWSIGYAPEGGKFLQVPLVEKGNATLGFQAGLLKMNNGSHYDAFRHRIIYPIHDHRGRVVSFAGRLLEGEGPKYLNGPESPVYEKSKVLYGLFQNQTAIRKAKKAYLVEGYNDVIALCKHEVQNVVASCGTAFTSEQARLLKKFTDTVIIFYDGDAAGIKAGVKALPLLLAQGLNVFTVVNMPEGKDPDDLCQMTDIQAFLERNIEDAVESYAKKIYDAADGVTGLAEARLAIAEIISYLPNEVYRDSYIQAISKTLKEKVTVLRKEVERLITARIVKIKAEHTGEDNVGGCFPRTDEQRSDYYRFGFWEEEDEKTGFGLFFQTKNGNIKLSNFIIKSLFRIEGVDDSKRIFEIRNQWQTRIVDLPTESLSSIARFTTRVESMGNFVFEGAQAQVNKLKLKLYGNEEQCREIKNLGWQTPGFWAFANGLFDGHQWYDVDTFGIAEVNDGKYFIAALSSIYSGDPNAFISDKRFIHIKNSNISFERWAELFVRVHGKTNGMLGILYFTSALFRDFFIKRFELFPHLFLFGQPATGKSQMARGLMSMFGKQQDVFNLNSGTNAGFFKKLGEFVNALVFLDEYSNNIDEKRTQLLKSAADGVGHVKSESTKDERTISTPVRSSALIAGQQLPNMDIALFTRCILTKFAKRDYDIPAYNELKELETTGLTSVTLQLLSLRDDVERRANEVFDQTFKAMKKYVNDKQQSCDDRLIRSYSLLMTMYELISDHYRMPVTDKDLITIIQQSMLEQNAQISGGNDVAIFWEYVEYLFSTHEIEEGRQFKFDGHKLLIRFHNIHKLYIKAYRQNTGRSGMDASSLRDYLANSDEWLGTVNSARFTDAFNNTEITSAYAFDYDKLSKKVNLIRTKGDAPHPSSLRQTNNHDSSKPKELF